MAHAPPFGVSHLRSGVPDGVSPRSFMPRHRDRTDEIERLIAESTIGQRPIGVIFGG
jgi:hypothetical protein